jgi:hypothetical protein
MKIILISILVVFILIELKDILKVMTFKSNNKKIIKKRKKSIPFK